jgi:hypothetical protein
VTPPGESDTDRATWILQDIIARQKGGLTPGVAVELARKLAHLAGGDGRGVYTVTHDPEGDRVA